MTFILHVFNPDIRPKDQLETWAFLNGFADKHPNIQIVHEKTDMRGGYERVFNKYFSEGKDFILVEQDIVPTEKQILDLADCKYIHCALWYWLYPVSTKLEKPLNACRNIRRATWSGAPLLPTIHEWGLFDDKPPEYCDVVPFGLTKFTKELMEKIKVSDYSEPRPPDDLNYWLFIDTRFSRAVWAQGIKAHLHGEVKHNHR